MWAVSCWWPSIPPSMQGHIRSYSRLWGNSGHRIFCLLQVSKASADLMLYCEEHAKKDPLLMGIPASENPFKDKKTCVLL